MVLPTTTGTGVDRQSWNWKDNLEREWQSLFFSLHQKQDIVFKSAPSTEGPTPQPCVRLNHSPPSTERSSSTRGGVQEKALLFPSFLTIQHPRKKLYLFWHWIDWKSGFCITYKSQYISRVGVLTTKIKLSNNSSQFRWSGPHSHLQSSIKCKNIKPQSEGKKKGYILLPPHMLSHSSHKSKAHGLSQIYSDQPNCHITP